MPLDETPLICQEKPSPACVDSHVLRYPVVQPQLQRWPCKSHHTLLILSFHVRKKNVTPDCL